MKRAKLGLGMVVVIAAMLVLGMASCSMPGVTLQADGLGAEKGIKAQANGIVVNFDPAGGVVETESLVVGKGQSYGTLPKPSRVGFAFGGWWTESEGRGRLVTSETKVTATAVQTLYAAWNRAPEKIVGTAVVGSECIFFEFSVEDSKKVVKVIESVSSSGFIVDGEVASKESIFDLPNLYVNYDYGIMGGMTEAKDGRAFGFQGYYSPTDGFLGEITKIDNGVVSRGYVVGNPVFKGTKIRNYIGAATYLFETATPQTLVFNASIDFDTNELIGTWSESGQNWGDKSVHGTVGGKLNSDGTISLTAAPRPEFQVHLLAPLSVVGQGSFLDPAKKVASGFLMLHYGPLNLPSTIMAVKETN
jgi:hypothetical protein